MNVRGKDIIDFLGPVALLGLSAAVGGEKPSHILALFAIHWGVDWAKPIVDRFCGRVLGDFKNNHDLQKVFGASLKSAVSAVEEQWWATSPEIESERIRDSIDGFFATLKTGATSLGTMTDAAWNDIGSLVKRAIDVPQRSDSRRTLADSAGLNHVIEFTNTHLVDEVKYQFGEALKSDHTANNRAWRAFQRWYLDHLQDSLDAVLSGQTRTQQEINELRIDLQEWQQRMNRLPESRENTGQVGLEEALLLLREQITDTIVRNGQETREIVRDDGAKTRTELREIAARSRPHLPLWLPERVHPLNQNPSQLLQPYNCFLNLIGREAELEELNRFRDSKESFAWQVLVAEGGVGKTRLALEFAWASARDGWSAGFLDAYSLNRFVTDVAFNEWFPNGNTLAVIDYAAGKLQDSMALLSRCAAISLDANKRQSGESRASIRLILIERRADRTRGWLKEIYSAGEKDIRDRVQSGFVGVTELFPPRLPKQDNPFTTTEVILRASFAAWSRVNGCPQPAFPNFVPGKWSDIQANTCDRPLYLQMAAIQACECGDPTRLPSWGRSELLHSAVARERMYIQQECRAYADQSGLCEVMENIAAILCLTGMSVTNKRNWTNIVADEIHESGYSNLQAGYVAEKLRAIFSFQKSGLEGTESTPIAPDILAEAFAAVVLLQEGIQPVEHLIRAVELSSTVTWSTLLRLIQDLHGLKGFERVTEWVGSVAAVRPHHEIVRVAREIPERSVSLRQPALQLCRMALQLWTLEVSTWEERAWLLIQLGIHLDAAGDLHSSREALSTTQDAIRICESRVAEQKETFKPILARAYHYLGRCHSTLREHQESLDATRKAVALREELAAEDRSTHLAALGRSLNNLSNELDACGISDEALVAAQRSALIAKELAQQNWKIYAAELGPSYSNLGDRLRRVGRKQEALDAITRSVEVREELAKTNPDEYAAGLVLSLERQAQLEFGMNRASNALSTCMKTVALYEELSSRDRARFGGGLVGAIDELEDLAWEFAEFEYVKLALKSRMRPLRLGGTQDRAGSAKSWTSIGMGFGALGLYEEALEACSNSVEIREILADENPNVDGWDLVLDLNNVAFCLTKLGRHAEAFPIVRRVDAFLSGQSNEQRAGNLLKTGQCLETLAVSLRDSGQLDTARKTGLDALQAFEGLGPETLAVHAAGHAQILHTLGSIAIAMTEIARAREYLALGMTVLKSRHQKDGARHRQLMKELYSDYCEVSAMDGSPVDESFQDPNLV